MADDGDEEEVTPPRGKLIPRRPNTHMGDDERAMLGSARRRSVMTDPRGTPMLNPATPVTLEPTTGTFHLVERPEREGLSQSAIEVVRRSRRNSKDPALYEDVVNLADEFVRTHREREAQIDELLEAPRTVAGRLSAVEKTLKTAKRLLIAAVSTAGLSGGGLGANVIAHHDAGIRADALQQQQAKDIDRLSDEIRDLRLQLGRSAGPTGWLSPPAISPKGQ